MLHRPSASVHRLKCACTEHPAWWLLRLMYDYYTDVAGQDHFQRSSRDRVTAELILLTGATSLVQHFALVLGAP